jgi:DNA-binding MarR family transcriptional regulator
MWAMHTNRDRNTIGAFALMIGDEIARAVASKAPEAGPMAAALALLDHEPGLSIRTLSAGVGLSHAGTVRLVDRLVSEGLIERRGHADDGRAVSLYLTPTGQQACAAVLEARGEVLASSLDVLNADEIAILAELSQRVLRSRLRDSDHSYRICRLCQHDACTNCPIDAELKERVEGSAG